MNDLYQFIGEKIRDLRQNHAGKGISQEELAQTLSTTANTISRWETGTYKPSINDLYKIAKFFRVNVADFFPDSQSSSDVQALRLQALMSATGGLDDKDIDELTQYAQFRQARRKLKAQKKRK